MIVVSVQLFAIGATAIGEDRSWHSNNSNKWCLGWSATRLASAANGRSRQERPAKSSKAKLYRLDPGLAALLSFGASSGLSVSALGVGSG